MRDDMNHWRGSAMRNIAEAYYAQVNEETQLSPEAIQHIEKNRDLLTKELRPCFNDEQVRHLLSHRKFKEAGKRCLDVLKKSKREGVGQTVAAGILVALSAATATVVTAVTLTAGLPLSAAAALGLIAAYLIGSEGAKRIYESLEHEGSFQINEEKYWEYTEWLDEARARGASIGSDHRYNKVAVINGRKIGSWYFTTGTGYLE